MRSLSTDAFGNALGSSLADQASSSSTWTIGATEVASPVTTRVMGYSATVGPDDEIGPTTSVQLGQGDAIATPVQPYPPDNSVPLPHMADLPRPRMTISDEEALSIAVTLGGGMGVDPSIENPYVASGLYGLEGNIAAPIGQAMIDYKVGPRTLGLAGTVLSGYGVAAGLATGNVPLVALSLDQMYANANLAVNGESSPTFLNQGLQAGLGLQPSEAAVAERDQRGPHVRQWHGQRRVGDDRLDHDAVHGGRQVDDIGLGRSRADVQANVGRGAAIAGRCHDNDPRFVQQRHALCHWGVGQRQEHGVRAASRRLQCAQRAR
jgi:hypothetical protein